MPGSYPYYHPPQLSILFFLTPVASSSPRAALRSPHGVCPRAARGVVVAALASPSAVRPFHEVPEPLKGLPWLGPVDKIKLDEVFSCINQAFRSANSNIIRLELYGLTAVYLRHPDEISTILKNPQRFVKDGTGIENISDWLGNGLVSDLDARHHAAMREVLLPAFRAQSIKDLVPIFVKVGLDLAEVMGMEAGQSQDIEQLTRRATLDVIGLAAFGYDFRSLDSARQQQEAAANRHTSNGNGNAGHLSGATSSMNGTGAAGIADGDVDVIKVLDGMLTPAMLLVFKLPLPRFLTPGIKQYNDGVQLLEGVVAQVLQEVRSRGLDPSDRSLLSFMLRQQQAQEQALSQSLSSSSSSRTTILVDDKQIRDQLMTFMFAGSDTTASTLAFLLFELSRHPDKLARAAEEVEGLLGGQAPDEWTPDMFQRMTYLAGCINETLRLYPAAVEMARISHDEDVVLGGYNIPKGTFLLPDIYCMHRNEQLWTEADTWLPERWLPEHSVALGPRHPEAFMPFSTGPRSCIGRYFAQLELQVLAAVVLLKLHLGPSTSTVDLMQKFTLSSREGVTAVVTPK